MVRFFCYAAFALAALVGPLGLMGKVSAAFKVQTDRQDYTAESESGTGSSSETPSLPIPPDQDFHQIPDQPADTGAGSAGASSNTFSSGGTPGMLSELPLAPTPFVTRLRVARERVAVISPPRTVFEPPRAA